MGIYSDDKTFVEGVVPCELRQKEELSGQHVTLLHFGVSLKKESLEKGGDQPNRRVNPFVDATNRLFSTTSQNSVEYSFMQRRKRGKERRIAPGLQLRPVGRIVEGVFSISPDGVAFVPDYVVGGHDVVERCVSNSMACRGSEMRRK